MTDYREVLREWERQEPQRVPLDELPLERPRYQPRFERGLTRKERVVYDIDHKAHVAVLRARLPSRGDLDPILVARIGRTLAVIDGHHRAQAYRAAKRKTIPARIMEVDRQTAAAVSKLVNVGVEKLPLTPAQRMDSAWQFVVTAIDAETGKLPGWTWTEFAAQFGISRTWAYRMRDLAISTNRGEYVIANKNERDPATGKPRWRTTYEQSERARKAQQFDDAELQIKALEGYLQATEVARGRHVVWEGLRRWMHDEGPGNAGRPIDDVPPWITEGEPEGI